MRLMNLEQMEEARKFGTERKHRTMADRTRRTAQNATGKYYVDDSCIDCDLCRNSAPTLFGRDEQVGLSIVHRQPQTTDELTLAEDAREVCPSDSIGNDGGEHGIERLPS